MDITGRLFPRSVQVLSDFTNSLFGWFAVAVTLGSHLLRLRGGRFQVNRKGNSGRMFSSTFWTSEWHHFCSAIVRLNYETVSFTKVCYLIERKRPLLAV